MPLKTTPKIPDGMVSLMKDLAKSVLKEQPENIYLFAAEYFENLIRERDGTLDKGYETFRQYEEDFKHRKNELATFASSNTNVSGGPSASDASGMEVHGVAIKAKSRESKLAKLPMNRRKRLETVKSGSQDVEDEEKTSSQQVVHPMDTVAEQKQQQQTTATNVENVAEHKPRVLSSKKSTQNLNAIEEETNVDVSETQLTVASAIQGAIVAHKLAIDEVEQPDTPTNDTSLSDALTEPTVIEMDAIAELNDVSTDTVDEMKSETVEPPVVAATENDDDIPQTIVTEEFVEAKHENKLEAKPNIDRSRTPESDSGLSEKSFNLKVQENEENAVEEDNTIGDGESLNFSADIDLSKENFERVETPASNVITQKDGEFESVEGNTEIEPDTKDDVAEEENLTPNAPVHAGNEIISSETTQTEETVNNEASTDQFDTIEGAENVSIEKSDEKNSNKEEQVGVEESKTSDSNDLLSEKSPENDNLEDAGSAAAISAENNDERKMDDSKELAKGLVVNSGEGAPGSNLDAIATAENENEGMTEAIEEPWQSAMDKLSGKVDELDAHQKRIVREIQYEPEKETDVDSHTNGKECRQSTEMEEDENGKKVNMAVHSVHVAQPTVEKLVAVEQVPIDDKDHITEESTVEDVLSSADEKPETVIDGDAGDKDIDIAETAADTHVANDVASNETQKEIERPESNEIDVDEKIATEADEVPTVTAAEKVDAKIATENEIQVAPPPNEAGDDFDQPANINDSADEKNAEGEAKSEPEADAATNDKIDAENEEKSDAVHVGNEIETITNELKLEDSKVEASKETEHLEEVASDTTDVNLENEGDRIVTNPTDESAAIVQLTNSIPDGEQNVAEGAVEVGDQEVESENLGQVADAVTEVETSTEINRSEPVTGENKQSTQEDEKTSENIAPDEENNDIPVLKRDEIESIERSTGAHESSEIMDDVGDHRPQDNLESSLPGESAKDIDIADSKEPTSTIEIEAGEEINDNENDAKATAGVEVEHEVSEAEVEGGANGVKIDVEEKVDAKEDESVNPVTTAMQENENEQVSDEIHSAAPSLSSGEIAANQLETAKMEEIGSKTIEEPPKGTEPKPEAESLIENTSNVDDQGTDATDLPQTEIEIENLNSNVTGQEEINPEIHTAITDTAQENIDEKEKKSSPISSADGEKSGITAEGQIVQENQIEPVAVAVVEQSGEEIVNPVVAAMRNNEQFLNELHSPREQVNASLSDDKNEALKNEQNSAPAGSAKQLEIDGDGLNELNASNVNEPFEHGENVVMGDESVKDVDVLAHDALEHMTADSQNVDANTTKEIANDQIEPDSLDILADSLDASLEPSMEPDSLVDSKSLDSLEAKATTTIFVVGDEVKSDSASSIVDAMPSLNLASIENEHPPEGHVIEKDLLQVPLKITKPTDFKQPLGDVVNDQNNYRNINEQMKNQLAALDNVEQQPSIPIQIFNIEEVDSPLTPKPLEMMFELPQSTNKNFLFGENEKPIEQMVKEAAAELIPLKSAESGQIVETNEKLEGGNDEKKADIIASEADGESKASEAETDHLKPSFSASHDVASSDLSDTDTDKEKVEKKFFESGVDESSRDERDEVSEIENFDLSSCGEDSLEAMYYQIRKSEILVDKGKQNPTDPNVDDDKIAFPGKATDNLEQAFREVSGKKSLQSMESSTDEVIVHQLSTDTDGMLLMSGGEIESETETSACDHRTEAATAESTDEEFANPITTAMRQNEKFVKNMHAAPVNSQDEEPEVEQENDHFPSGYSIDADDMNVGNIRRKIMASSVSEADSDYLDYVPSAAQTHRLTKDDFNISTAFEHMIRSDSTTDSESTIESAATKIQAGARGFLTRRRLRRSNSTSAEKHSSIGNAAIDNSLDDLVENSASELVEHHRRQLESDETVDDDGSPEDKMMIFGITDVKVEHKKPVSDEDATIANIIISGSQPSEAEPQENETEEIDAQPSTAQRRLTLQRGDAVQRYSTPEESSDNRNDASTDQSTAALVESSDPSGKEKEDIQISAKSQHLNGTKL